MGVSHGRGLAEIRTAKKRSDGLSGVVPGRGRPQKVNSGAGQLGGRAGGISATGVSMVEH